MNQIQNFKFDGAVVRTVSVNGEPWFVAADVCAALTIANGRDALTRLDDDEKGVASTDTLGGAQQVTTVNESGLYSLILGSRKPEAKAFKKWVTGTVLPEIRKTGSYQAPATDPMVALSDPIALRHLLLENVEKVITLQESVDRLTPKAQALDRLATFDAGSYGLREAGKLLGVPQNEFLMYLKAKGWIYKITGQKDWLATSVVCKRQLMDHKMIEGDKAGGGRWQRTTAVITARGMAKLAFDLKSKPDADRLAA